MPSKTSFCNGTEFRKCLSRWWPLWVIYGVILFILLPGVLLNARSTIPYVSAEQISYLSNVILSETQMLLPLTAFCAGLLAAAAMFGYLYTPRGAGLAASLPIEARVYVPHASAGGAFDAAVGRGRSVRSCRAHRGGALHARHRAAAHLAGHTRASRRWCPTASPCCAPCSPATWSCCRVPVPARELHRRGLPGAHRIRALHVRVRHVGHDGSAGRLALPLVLFMRRTNCRSQPICVRPISGTRGRGGRQTLRLGPIRSSGRRSRCCCSCARVSSTGAADMESAGDVRRHPGAQAGAEVYRGALCRAGAAGRRVRHAAQRAGLPGATGAVPAADRSWRGARLCHQRDGHPQVPARPAHGLARLRGHGGRVLPRRGRRKVRPLGLRPPHPGYRAGQKRAHHLQRLQLHAHRGGERSGRGGHRTAPSWRSAKRSRTTPASPVCS